MNRHLIPPGQRSGHPASASRAGLRSGWSVSPESDVQGPPAGDPSDLAFAGMREQRKLGFSLLELLAVMAVVSILAVVTVPAISSISESSHLAQAGQVVVDQLSLARQLAMARDATVEVRFIKKAGEDTYRAVQLWSAGPSGEPLERIQTLPGRVCLNEPLSPFLDRMLADRLAGTGPAPGADYKAFRVRPTGLVEPLPAAPADRSRAYLTLTAERFAQDVAAPPNFITVQVNPDTGVPLVYQP